MDRYQRVERPKRDSPINENEIRITAQGLIRNYVSYATTLLQEKRMGEIVLKAMGLAISKSVAVTEIIKKNFPQLHQDTAISSVSITDVWEPMEEGLVPVEMTRQVSMISITLSTRDTNKNSPGYQAPLNDELSGLQHYQKQPQHQQARAPYNAHHEESYGRGKGGYGRGRGRSWRGGYGNYQGGRNYQDENYESENYNGGNYEGGNYRDRNYEGGNYRGRNYEGGNYRGRNYEGGNYGGRNYEGGNYGGRNYEGGNYGGRNYEGGNYGGRNYEGGNYGGRNYEGGNYGNRNYEGGNYRGGAYQRGNSQEGNYQDTNYKGGYSTQGWGGRGRGWSYGGIGYERGRGGGGRGYSRGRGRMGGHPRGGGQDGDQA
ncbi:hypothetical protein SAY87_003356 [Trapa incisa]|uniref:DNA/RNA-binding protein Alba-like domain-containing protein n=1 Tax=Trapa incisa TaxID=236973 RepID=A0AAN7QL49_9MYRT|nr:hypothetical protein SAY87_003356 [Trapa incisa]